jgi:hypothetical protein
MSGEPKFVSLQINLQTGKKGAAHYFHENLKKANHWIPAALAMSEV